MKIQIRKNFKFTQKMKMIKKSKKAKNSKGI